MLDLIRRNVMRRPIPESLMGHLGIASAWRMLMFAFCVVLALAVVVLPEATAVLEPPARRALFILVLAASLWVTATIPAFAVGILVIGLDLALLSTPVGGAVHPRAWEETVAVIGHPLVWLFFGGFVLAAGMSSTGLDRQLAVRLLGRWGGRPSSLLVAVMVTTFVLSMFMSNTATTAMMMAVLAPLLAGIERGDPYGRALLLATAVAANIGGMASLIGTPPNAIAVGALNQLPTPYNVDFLRWILIAGPVAIAVAALAGWFILRLYPARPGQVPMAALHSSPAAQAAPLWKKIVMSTVLTITVGLWLTSQWHSIPAAAVSFVPIVLLTTTGVLGAQQVRGLQYDVLFLLAGGLALGDLVQRTGLSAWLVAGLPSEDLGLAGITLAVCYLTVLLSNVMSNTAAANIIVPLGMAMALGSEPRIALPIAMSASAAMCLPIATPPNALVYANGRLRTWDLFRMGLVIGLIVPPLAVGVTTLWYW